MVAIGSGVGGVETLFANPKILETKGARRVSPFVVPYSIVNMPSGIVAIHFQLGGPNLRHSTACATSTHAIGESAEAIARGSADVALAGGTEAPMVPLSAACRGGLEAILSISALHAQLLPPTIRLETVGPDCELDHVIGKARPAQASHILSNSFGFGGTNGSLIFSHPDA